MVCVYSKPSSTGWFDLAYAEPLSPAAEVLLRLLFPQ